MTYKNSFSHVFEIIFVYFSLGFMSMPDKPSYSIDVVVRHGHFKVDFCLVFDQVVCTCPVMQPLF